MSVFKTVRIKERYSAEFRAEALNAMNTPLFASPITNISLKTSGSDLQATSRVTSAWIRLAGNCASCIKRRAGICPGLFFTGHN